ncbi:bifunctional [glutamine synthetase] adenylyltransferase/[glutamine synthetase]-adenylyl-L-tyrosine phosphorylase [Sphingosinicella sp. LHD-64]|uniref:bifunctional [glutamine synthetase] adenylyltransferase/[glutamine synthetase]-adenylyl-L-tyrosine phosphorylase n=1 Tax=Sphingosinicella sp. LHD-64 TaxID=3072139 RepID=UPI00280DAB4B|nr:bifunctional [glutamine synthetase] adenylyltransferase/[glutamine synthetase]-adenylyl-L-tyrosine phosphorylase [Sphingosinicella sp. LHD-64]MDQ8758198.1 bifunctional [glutamine synthetase] adenylyltransferase/[glutamine synthetase]-adenylyl-L-tyrosine phosphorylase [Sphingosinicella sp. LHD-64]
MKATVLAVREAIERGRTHSPFLRFQLDQRPQVAAALEAGDMAAAIVAAAAEAGDGNEVMVALRRRRSALALALGIGDLAGVLSFAEVSGALSDLADATLEQALTAAIAERTPEEAPRGFAVIALGKLGGRELNYSSDVDLIYLYDPGTLPRRPREEPDQAALRIGQRVTELLQKRTEDGYAFRVDLRLRPSPEVTPIALPVEAAISYYESSALPWERAAFIRARQAAGDPEVGRYFLDAVQPFVWRRSLDFGAIGEVQSMSRLIRDHYAQGQRFGPGYDLKRGRGGIREVEFFVQIHQLIHGGREPALRAPRTLDALAALAEAGRADADDAAALAAAYPLLRTIEHRLQMVDDLQTHSLPQGRESLDNVARLHGLADGEALLDLVRPHVERVEAIYDRLGGGEARRLPADADALEAGLAQAGFADSAGARGRIEGWRSGKARSLRTPAAIEAFEAMLPALIDAFAAAPDPMRAMNRFDNVVERLPTGLNLYRLLEARPALTQHLGAILSHAPALADQLARRPELLDGLIDASAFEPARSVPALAQSFARAGEDYERYLDRVRRDVNEARFALGTQVVLARSDPLEAALGYARVAEAAVEALAGAAVAEFEQAHGKVQGCELIILGLGRLGGGALTHASDLDLIYLFSGSHEAESDGAKPLRANDYFNRLAPRVTAALSVPTAAGPLYEVDTRLRPSGTDGMLAVSAESFADYQRTRAWTFEHMALTRARPVFGSDTDRMALSATIDGLLRMDRDPARVRADAARMRLEIARHKPAKGLFDIKLGPGALVDLEFAVQVLQLVHHAGLTPDTGAAIDALISAGLMPGEIGDAYRLLTAMLVTLRLVSPESTEPAEASRLLVARACGLGSWQELLAAHARARQSIGALWLEVSAAKGG